VISGFSREPAPNLARFWVIFFLQTSSIKNDTTKIPGTVHMDRVLPNQLIVAHLFSVPNGGLKMHYGVHMSPIKKATQAHWNLPHTPTTDDFNIH
jgi:hypothetical protein